MTDIKKILCSVGIVIISLILLIPFLCTLIMSFVDYNMLRGLFGSAWVGFENFSRLFSSAQFLRILLNSVVISIFSLVIGAVYVFISAFVIGNTKSPVLKGFSTAIFAVPAAIPVGLLVNIFPTEFLVQPSLMLVLGVAAMDGIRLAGLITCIAAFIKGDVMKESVKCVLIFIAIRLVYIVSPDFEVVNGVYNPATYEILDVIPTTLYRAGLMNGQFSFAAAGHIAKVLIQLVPTVIACVIMVSLYKNRLTNNERNISLPVYITVISWILPLAVLVSVIITGSSILPSITHMAVLSGYLYSFIIAVASALLVSGIAFGLALLARNVGAVGIVFPVILCLTGNSVPAKYLLEKTFGLVNTFAGVVLYNFSMIAVLALIMCFATYKSRSVKNDIMAFVIGFALMFSRFWGDGGAATVLLSDRSKYPLSLVLREIYNSPVANSGVPFSTVPYIIIPVLVVGAAFVVCSIIKED